MITLLHHRRYILENALHDFRHHYAGTGSGILWNFIHPLAMVAVYWLVFSALMPTRFDAGDHQPRSYLLYLCSGLLPWLVFGDCLRRGTTAFRDHAAYLKKLAIPETVFSAKVVASSALTMAISLALVFAVAILEGRGPDWTWALTVPVLVLLLVFAYGLGLALGTLNVFFPDLAQLIPILLQIGMWLVPIVYAPTLLPSGLRPLLALHPYLPFLVGLRDILVDHAVPAPVVWLGMMAWAALGLVAGSFVLRRLRGELRDLL